MYFIQSILNYNGTFAASSSSGAGVPVPSGPRRIPAPAVPCRRRRVAFDTGPHRMAAPARAMPSSCGVRHWASSQSSSSSVVPSSSRGVRHWSSSHFGRHCRRWVALSPPPPPPPPYVWWSARSRRGPHRPLVPSCLHRRSMVAGADAGAIVSVWWSRPGWRLVGGAGAASPPSSKCRRRALASSRSVVASAGAMSLSGGGVGEWVRPVASGAGAASPH